MRYLIFIFLFFVGLNVSAQKPYAWINMQYNANYNGEFSDLFEYGQMEGPVQSIETYVYIEEQDSFSLENTAIYNVKGQFIRYESYYMRENNHRYYFDENGVHVYRGKTLEIDTSYYVFEYNAQGDSVKSASKWWSDSVYTDTHFYALSEHYLTQDKGFDLVYDSIGNVVEYWFDSVPVYTIFDEYGRKVCDSVPGTGHGTQHVYTYSYSENTVITKYQIEGTETVAKYEVDANGNWIKMYYREDSANWELYSIRNITYY